jgi:type II restriction/modification system DNA methylase subunit YeeA
MNTNALKKFAQEARIKLLDQVGAKLEYVLNTDTPEFREKGDQVRKLREELTKTTKEQLIDKVSYTWFNRFMALRFMDANDYQPIGLRVLTPKKGYTLPELLDEAKSGNIPEELKVKNQRIYDLLDGKIPSPNAQNEAYKELLIGACNNLNRVFPFLFERISDYTELLLPDDLTSELSIVQDIRNGMTIDDCAEVEIIGWLYQFYISAKKDEVFASKAAVKKEDIPAATQLFTPRWIVEYMVQNTVGKLWLQNRPNSNLREYMPYFVESPSVLEQEYLKINSVEEIKLLDQACGSGHILVYGFDLFYKIYEEEGYNPNEIAQNILSKNLFGFEIDERASQLAAMAIMMKARSYNRRIFKTKIEPKILCYQDLTMSNEVIEDVFKNIGGELSVELKYDFENIRNATNYGSLIIPKTDTKFLRATQLLIKGRTSTDAFEQYNLQLLITALEQLILLSEKYHCVVDNPPYMGEGKMNKNLGNWVRSNYPKSRADLMVCFMERAQYQLLNYGFVGMINLPSWMFLSSFESYRGELLEEYGIDTLLHLGRGIFGADFGSVAFTLIKGGKESLEGIYRRLFKDHVQVRSIDKIESLFLDKNYGLFNTRQSDFKNISGFPIAYWASKNVQKIFSSSKKIIDVGDTFQGMITGSNEYFLRYWQEVQNKTIKFDATCPEDIDNEITNWLPYNKGGKFRKWYGNQDYVVNWKNRGKDFTRGKNGFSKYFFREYMTWTYISASTIATRYFPPGFIWDVSGSGVFPQKREDIFYLQSLIASNVGLMLLKMINPTINFQVENIAVVPVVFPKEVEKKGEIVRLVERNIDISKVEWDSREDSWLFKKNELIRVKGQDLEESYNLYQYYWKIKFNETYLNEIELNKYFISIYELEDELTPQVPLQDITILKEETTIENGELSFKANEVFAQFISYSVGCMFGRYSLEKDGIVLANQEDNLEIFLSKIGKPESDISFLPDEDNIIPILDDEWFEDDITARFYTFLKASFGVANFDKNLAFVEECLGKDVRKYFVKDFYADHIKRYKKRPIYWMFSSPKGSFNVLIYMHRYTPDTLNNILNDYLIEYREKLHNRIEHLDHLIVSGTSLEQTKAQKEKDRLKLVLIELLEYEREVLRPLAIERIKIDLDEGVLVNYNKFGQAIKEVAGLNDKATKKKVREFDWINVEEIH